MKKKLLIIIISFLLLNIANACTSIGFSGNYVADGGTIVAKNRDATINGFENLEIFKPKGKIPYLALTYGLKYNKSYISAGTNEKGLTVLVNAPGSHLPSRSINLPKDETNVVQKILSNYSTVAQVKDHAKQLFGNSIPALYIISDHHEVANFESGYNNKYGENIVYSGYVWNTNYFHLPPVYTQNLIITKGVAKRNLVIHDWFNYDLPAKVGLGDLTRFMASRFNGAYYSINRAVTVAKYFVVTPDLSYEPSHVLIKFTNPKQNYNNYDLKLDEDFFKLNPAGPINNKKYGLLGSINEKLNTKFTNSLL